MATTLCLSTTSTRLRLAPGATITCLSGALWLTLEARGAAGPSPDVLLAPGERHRLDVAATCFLHPLHPGVATRCEVEAPPRTRWPLQGWLAHRAVP